MTTLDPLFQTDEIKTIRVRTSFYPSKRTRSLLPDLCRNAKYSNGQYQCTRRCLYPWPVKSHYCSRVHPNEQYQTKTQSIEQNFHLHLWLYSHLCVVRWKQNRFIINRSSFGPCHAVVSPARYPTCTDSKHSAECPCQKCRWLSRTYYRYWSW